MERLVLFCLLSLPAVLSFECWSCGVHLSAPTNECKGTPRNVTCPSDSLGCLYISAQNTDGTYYVEKNCVQQEDDIKTEGCIQIALRGMKATQCICKDELCNGTMTSNSLLIIGLLSAYSISFFH